MLVDNGSCTGPLLDVLKFVADDSDHVCVVSREGRWAHPHGLRLAGGDCAGRQRVGTRDCGIESNRSEVRRWETVKIDDYVNRIVE